MFKSIKKSITETFSLIIEDQITEQFSKNCNFQYIEIDNIEEMVRIEHFPATILVPLLNMELKQ